MTEIQKEAHIVYTLLFVFHLMFSFLVAITIGYRKTIGYFWSFFFGLVFSPMIGLLVTGLSKDRITKEPPPYWHVYVPLCLMIVLSTLAITGLLWTVPGNFILLLSGWVLIALTGTIFFFWQQKRRKSKPDDI